MTGAITLYKKTKNKLSDIACGFLFALLLAQPLLDIISYWANEWAFTTLTTLVRFGMFAMVVVYGFIISDKKWAYIAGCAVMGAYWIVHVIACIRSEGGYVSPVSDMNNFLRTIHLPLFTFVFITIFKKSHLVPVYVQKAFVINMVVMMHALVLSYMTGSQIYTYTVAKLGLMGWASVHNSQSAILSFIVPLMLLYAYNKKNKIVYYATAFVCFINLFFVGTKVAYFSIFIISLSMMILLIIAGEKKLFYYAVLFVIALLCALCINHSIAVDVKITHTSSMAEKQQWVANTMEQEEGEAPLPSHISWEIYNGLDPIKRFEIRRLYEKHLGPVVQRFGFERVFEEYDFSMVVAELTAARPMKRNFARMAFEDSNLLTKMFGYEYCVLIETYEYTNYRGETYTVDYVFDLENDFPSVFYYSGYVGFAVYMLFLAYFVGLIFVAVVTRFKKCVNLENGLLAVTFGLMMGSSQYSGNVLRRPNVSIYISVILAYIYYVTVVKENVKYRDLFTIFKKKKKA